jgi:hypothetical protein
MEALSVGMFIRTPLGIDKIIYLRIQDEYGCNYDTQLEHNLFLNNERNHISIDGECFEKEEIKTSYNIIDILEIGDYVNGSPICSFKTDEKDRIWIYTDSNYKYGYLENEIKSIVTKEMFSSMEYRLGDDK